MRVRKKIRHWDKEPNAIEKELARIADKIEKERIFSRIFSLAISAFSLILLILIIVK